VVDAEALRRRLLAGDDPGRTSRGWSMAESASYSPDQRFGPLTPVVSARAAQLWQADLVELNTLMRFWTAVTRTSDLMHPISAATEAAVCSGRAPALRDVWREAEGLVRQMTESPLRRMLWSDVVASLVPPRSDPGSRALIERVARLLLRVGTLAVLCVEVVADVVEREALLQARGPVEHAIGPTIEIPGPEWCAPETVLGVVRTLLDPLDATDLVDIAHRHDRRVRAALGFEAYARAFAPIHGLALAGPAGCPWAGVLDDGRLKLGLNASPVRCRHLREWASGVTAVLCHRSRVADADVATFAAPYRDLLPDLEDVLDEAVAGPRAGPRAGPGAGPRAGPRAELRAEAGEPGAGVTRAPP
jgi:hypothetical protein